MTTTNNVNGCFGDTKLTKVFVGGLAWDTQKEAMHDHFIKYGDILEAVIIFDKLTRRSKGYGFVCSSSLSLSFLFLLVYLTLSSLFLNILFWYFLCRWLSKMRKPRRGLAKTRLRLSMGAVPTAILPPSVAVIVDPPPPWPLLRKVHLRKFICNFFLFNFYRIMHEKKTNQTIPHNMWKCRVLLPFKTSKLNRWSK